MLDTFLALYNDETIYSWCVRYHRISGNSKISDTILKLFGHRSIQDIIYSRGLEHFSKQIPEEINYSSDYLIDNHTFYILNKPFMSQDISIKYRNSMEKTEIRRLERIVQIDSSFETQKTFKLCPVCAEFDEKKYGEIYLHRIHQVQGIFVCPIHETNLNIFPYDNMTFVDIDNINIKANDNMKFNDKTYLKLSIDINRILNLKKLNKYSILDIVKKYKQKLHEKNYYTFQGLIRYENLVNDFNDYYSEELLDTLNSKVDISSYRNWIKFILTKTKNEYKMVHPIRHLLFIYFLFGSLDEFDKYSQSQWKPFGDSPWPCLNKCCPKYKENTIVNCRVEEYRKERKVSGYFECPVCGFEYVRRGPDKLLSDRYKKGRIDKYGPLWEKKLIQAVSNPGISLRKIAEIMKSDKATVKRQIIRMHISNDFIEEKIIYDTNDNSLTKEKLNEYKYRILKLINSGEGLTRNKICRILHKETEAVREKDKDWYENNMPLPISKSSTSKQYYIHYWSQRDTEISPKVEKVIGNIIKQCIMKRITISYVSKLISYRNLRDNLDKLPLTNKILKKYCETSKQYKDRVQKYKKR